jgi:hypothetical protein
MGMSGVVVYSICVHRRFHPSASFQLMSHARGDARQTMVCGRLTPELLAWLTLGIWFACWPMAYGAEPTIRASVVGRNGVLLLVVDTEVRRLLLADEVILGAEYVAEWARDQAAFSGMALMQTVAFLDPPPSAVLALGLGSGTVPAFLRDRSSACSDSSS